MRWLANPFSFLGAIFASIAETAPARNQARASAPEPLVYAAMYQEERNSTARVSKRASLRQNRLLTRRCTKQAGKGYK